MPLQPDNVSKLGAYPALDFTFQTTTASLQALYLTFLILYQHGPIGRNTRYLSLLLVFLPDLENIPQCWIVWQALDLDTPLTLRKGNIQIKL